MFIHARCAFLLFALLPCTSVVSAQRDIPYTPPAPGKIYLDVVVSPKSGPLVSGLQQQDFTLLDNKSPAPITSFKAMTSKQSPVDVLLVVDAVNTSYSVISYERAQIDKLLLANEGHIVNPTALAVFTDSGIHTQENYSNDGKALASALDQFTIGLRTIRRSSGVYGASERFELSLQALQRLATAEATRPGRKVILWVSPGWPLLSGPATQLTSKQHEQIFEDIVNISTRLRQARITLYSIDPLGSADLERTHYWENFLKGATKNGHVDPADLGLEVLAVQSGGLALNSSNDIAALLQQCIADTVSYYELSFDPLRPEQGDEYHHLEIRISRPGLAARTRQGYYAQP
jgi:VWFA-related protein